MRVAELQIDAPGTGFGVERATGGDGHREHPDVEAVDDLAVTDGAVDDDARPAVLAADPGEAVRELVAGLSDAVRTARRELVA